MREKFRIFLISISGNDLEKSILKENLHQALHEKLSIVEKKREKMLKLEILERRIQELPDCLERRKLMFKASNQEKAIKKNTKKDCLIEQQELHESYQILLMVT